MGDTEDMSLLEGLPADIHFTGTWRPYQQRVISELKQHMEDHRLHVVAAPGSGKTVLGLEVVRRLNKPALVLAPTLIIRDQWIDRLLELFIPASAGCPNWVSTDIRKPGVFTIATYQALHCTRTGEVCQDDQSEEEDELAATEPSHSSTEVSIDVATMLKAAGVGTVVVDKAHHLRSEWWKSLISTVRELDEPSVVALTATPPYDVPALEWNRYVDLCGPVDAEICAPELVLDGNLCPHQDYVYLNRPSAQEQMRIREFRRNVEDLVNDLRTNEEFVAALESHPWLTFPDRHVNDILSDPDYFTSIAIFLNSVRGRVPKELLEVMGLSKMKLPSLNNRWLEILLEGRLYRDAQQIGEWDPMLKLIRDRLSRIGAAERKRVYLRSTPGLDHQLATSINKLDSISEIVKLEHSSLGRDLRMVVLTDFIRASEMPDSPEDTKPLSRIGAVPIFEKIRRNCPGNIALGILTRSLVVVPASCENTLRAICAEHGVGSSRVYLTPLYHDPRYCRLIIDHDAKSAVHVVTELFSRGEITVIVGTKSLLGEGWDAPCVNSLILASFVGSYMLSNQMRGRAIRSVRGNPNKTANIWHLISVDPDSPSAGADFDTLKRRFRAFVGVSFVDNTIHNGIERLGLGETPYNEARISEINARMCRLALDRAGLRKRWEEALDLGGPGRLIEQIRTQTETLPRRVVYGDSIFPAVFFCGIWGAAALSGIWSVLDRMPHWDKGGSLNDMAFAALAVVSYITWKSGRDVFVRRRRHRTPAGSIEQIGCALLDSLVYAKAIRTPAQELCVVGEIGSGNTVQCSLIGATSRESAIFLEAMQEILSPIADPRYLIMHSSLASANAEEQYRAVPSLLGQKKEYAEYYRSRWAQRVASCKLVFTRNFEGKQTLLRAKELTLSSSESETVEGISSWK